MTAAPARRPFDPDRLTAALTAESGGSWRAVTVTARTGSTNADLRAALAAAPDPDALAGTVLLADTQEEGRGRHGRGFGGAPLAQIPVSVVLDLSGVPMAGLGWLPLITGVAVVETLREVGGLDAALKWPNDVLVRGEGAGKIAGILAEVFRAGDRPLVVLGVGLNVDQRADELPVDTATSLALAGARTLDRDALVIDFLTRLAARVDRWCRRGGVDGVLLADYRAHCSTIGLPVRALLPGDAVIAGRADDVDDQGRLLIAVEHVEGDAAATVGGVAAVAAGDVTHLRPAPDGGAADGLP